MSSTYEAWAEQNHRENIANLYEQLRDIRYWDHVRHNHVQYRSYGQGWMTPVEEWTALRIAPAGTAGYYGSQSAEILDESNADAIKDEFSAYGLEDQLTVFEYELITPLYVNDDPAQGFTPGAVLGMTLLEQLEDYPALDETDHHERDHEARLEQIDEGISWTLGGMENDDDRERLEQLFFECVELGESSAQDCGLDDVQFYVEKELEHLADQLGINLEES